MSLLDVRQIFPVPLGRGGFPVEAWSLADGGLGHPPTGGRDQRVRRATLWLSTARPRSAPIINFRSEVFRLN